MTGTHKAADKFKANTEEKKKVPNGHPSTSNHPNILKRPTTPSPPSPTKPVVGTKPVSHVKSNSSTVSTSSSSAIATSLNKALNPGPVTSLPLPPEEKGSGVNNNYQFDETPLPPPPEEFLSPTSTTFPKAKQTVTSPTTPKSGRIYIWIFLSFLFGIDTSFSYTLGYVGISSAKPFGSSASGGPKFRPMSAAFKV